MWAPGSFFQFSVHFMAFFFPFFKNQISLDSPGWSGTGCIDQAGLCLLGARSAGVKACAAPTRLIVLANMKLMCSLFISATYFVALPLLRQLYQQFSYESADATTVGFVEPHSLSIS